MGNFSSSMGKALNNLFYGYNKNARIVMLGLDAAGKTTIMYKYKLDETINTIPTIGFNVETLQINKINMTMWDVGGQNKIRPLWRHYYSGSDALIWVIDSADTERFIEAKEELHHALLEPELANVTILVFANKADLANPKDIAQLHKTLELPNISNGRKFLVQPCCATTGDGLYEGMDWLCNQLS
uniref:ADP-ribosylation factor n=1 Tax=Vannella robusta TaxID=1487602 RepID=A0A7S4IFE4_9EUKA|mmetsp:Transcript_25008/g.31826  ORF Transcript_25008/g.31826 Transcript_25008/m.31826 type:complete len:185 (+) Transcript_25008:60-614(+)